MKGRRIGMKKTLMLVLTAALLLFFGCARIPEPVAETDAPTEIPTVSETPVPTEEPTPEQTPTPAPTEEPTPTPLVTVLYKSRVNELNVRSAPSLDSEIVGKLSFEENVEYIDNADGSFARVLYKGEIRYCYASYLVPAEETLYGYLAPRSEYKKDKDGNIVYEDGKPVVLTAELIDIRLLIPDIEIYQIFGTPENFTGEVLYQRPVPVLQLRTARKLAEAARRFAEDGYKIKIYDCYRPKSVQFILYDIVQNSAYIANPYKSASNHNRAAAVDMTLIGPDGVELEFPTPMHTFESIVYRASSSLWTEEQRRNVDYMTDVMVSCGFKIIRSEWWHFSDTDYEEFMVLDIDMRDIPMYTASYLGWDNN